MTYELAVVPSDTPDPVERAYELMDPFCHTEECWNIHFMAGEDHLAIPMACHS